jgi:hypothetical protein
MNPRLRLWLKIGIPVALLASVNPGFDEFSTYVHRQSTVAGKAGDRPLRGMMSGISADALKEAREKGATRKNYVIFSIFEIRNAAEGKVHRILGFGKKIFIPLNETPKWEELKLEFGG